MKTYNLSPVQCRIYDLQKNNDVLLYAQAVLQIDGQIDISRLLSLFNTEVSKHSILRTTYQELKESKFPLQVVHNNLNPVLVQFDLSNFKSALDITKEIDKVMLGQRNQPINKEGISLLNVNLFKCSESQSFLGITIPALSADSYSIKLLLTNIVRSYCEMNSLENSEEVIQYPQVAGWQQTMIETPDVDASDFWEKYLTELTKQERFPFTKYNQALSASRFKTNECTFDASLSSKIVSTSQSLNTGIDAIMASAIIALHYKHSKNNNSLGFVLSDRLYDELKYTLGAVSKTLPLGIANLDQLTIKELILNMSEAIQGIVSWQDFYSGIDYSPKDKDESSLPFCYGLEYIDLNELNVQIAETKFKLNSVYCASDQFDLKLMVSRRGDILDITFIYDTTVFSFEAIEQFRKQFIKLLHELLANLQLDIDNLTIPCDSSDADDILNVFNHKLPEANYQTINELFEKQALKNPSRVAVVSNGNSISYEDLYTKVEKLAAYLIDHNLKRNAIVGIMIEPSLEMIIGILGILRAGGAYLPIDKRYPIDRINYMLTDSKINFLLINGELSIELDITKYNIVDLGQKAVYASQKKNIVNCNEPSDLAYVIYTSGSTGNPKGVMVAHSNVHSLIKSLNEIIYKKLPEHLQVGLLATYSFDGSVKQIFASLLLGHTLHLVDENVKTNGLLLVEYFVSQKIDVTDVTPVHINMLLNSEIAETKIGVKYFLSGGQILHKKTIEDFYLKYVDRPIVINVYGPTECCVDASSFTINPDTINHYVKVPIGRPILNSYIYILNNDKSLAPKGVVGEVYIGGHGVSKGYINSLELTRQKFITDPFHKEQCLYRTGDLGKWLLDGQIEFVGRNDNQVKIRGFRIELGEIENVILNIPYIKDCVVSVKSDNQGNNFPVAYLISDKPVVLSEIIMILREKLPHYMLPSYFVPLSNIPHTLNGKINYKMLPDPEGIELKQGTEYAAPRNETERILVNIWCQVLNKQVIGINNNFYEAGGDSIKAIQISARLFTLGLRIEIKELLANPSIAELAEKVYPIDIQINQNPVTGQVLLTPMQAHFFIHEDVDMNHFNMAMTFYNNKGIEFNQIKAIFSKIQEHHDILRASFQKKSEKLIQTIESTDLPLDISVHTIFSGTMEQSMETYIKKANEMQASLDLNSGPLMKLGLFKMPDGDRLLVIFHHLVIDPFSWRILFEDLKTLYQQVLDNRTLTLPSKTTSYKAWADALHVYASNEAYSSAAQYWENICTNEIPCIPQQGNIGKSNRNSLNYKSFELNEMHTQALLNESSKFLDVRPIEIMITAFGHAMYSSFNLRKTAIFLEGHGRETLGLDVDVSRTIGWFSTIYPFIVNISSENDWRESIELVKADLRAVPDNGIGYGVFKYISKKKGETEMRIKPSILFNYLGQFDSDIEDMPFELETNVGQNISIKRKNRFEILFSLIIVNKKLQVNVQYNNTLYEETSLNRLLEIFQKQLIYITTNSLTNFNQLNQNYIKI